MNRTIVRIGTLACALALSISGASAQDRAQQGPPAGAQERFHGHGRGGPGGHGRGGPGGPGRGGPGGPGEGHHNPEQRLARLTERLHLDTNQQALIREAFARVMQERRARREAPPANRQARHQAFEQMRARMTSEIDAVLTPQQRTEFARMQAEHENRRQQHQGRCNGGEQRDPV
ncbi:MAG: hypothetical protein IPK60_03625 [Sandaracinaceae bacterium]|nr:hypothetical protein [Sandaracinaceae bacterium]